MAFQWPEEIDTEKNPNRQLAHNLPMNEIFNLKFDAFIRDRGDKNQDNSILLFGTDGGQFTDDRCGGRLPAILVYPGSTNNNYRTDFKELSRKIGLMMYVMTCHVSFFIKALQDFYSKSNILSPIY